MTSAIQEPANDNYDFGYEFNYSLWTMNTRLTLVNVPWNNDYRDIVKFANRDALNSYIDSQESAGIVIDNVSYVRPSTSVRLDIAMNKAYKYNYLRASNPLQPIGGGDIQRDWYYFIQDVRYIAPNTTELVLQLDVWQSFGFDITFGNSYIDRGHIGIANENGFDNYGRDYLTLPEGLDTGAEYQVIATRRNTIMSDAYTNTIDWYTNSRATMMILVVSTVDLLANPGTVSAPLLNSADGAYVQGIPSGASFYVWPSAGSFRAWMKDHQSFPWITQGIISISIIPSIDRYRSDYDPNAVDYGGPLYGVVKLGSAGNAIDVFNPIMYTLFPDWREHADVTNNIPDRYKGLKKFFTYPYMVIELTSFTGTPVLLKPESWSDDDATIVESIAVLPPNQKLSFSPYKYNALPGSITERHGVNGIPGPQQNGSLGEKTVINWNGTNYTYWKPQIAFNGLPYAGPGGDDHGEWMDVATVIANFPTIPIVNNMAINYLASNAHSIAFGYQSADWAQQRALNANSISYDQASGAAQTQADIANRTAGGVNAQANQDIFTAGNQALINGLTQTAQAGNSILAGGIVGPVIGLAAAGAADAFGYLNTQQQILGSAKIGNSVQMGNAQSAINQSNLVRDTNKYLADWSARGDYATAINGLNAKVQDSKMIQPTTSGQMGGETMNLAQSNVGVGVRIKMLDHASMRAVGEFWLRYGYSVHQFGVMPASLQVMTKFTYWKLLETYVSSASTPEGFKQVIRGIFEKGVTVWADPSFIGNTDLADNIPLPGVIL